MKIKTSIQKLIVLLLTLVLVLTALSGCSGQNTVDPTKKAENPTGKSEDPTQNTTNSGNGTFSIHYDLGRTADYFTNTPSEAKTGDTVEIKTLVLLDDGIHVYLDGQEIQRADCKDSCFVYTFVMPEKDVLITAQFYTYDEIWGIENIPVVWAENMNVKKTEIVKQTMNTGSFDERLLNYLSEHTEGNYMASPLSFRYALGLLLAGANGETKTELLNAFGVSSEEEWVNYCLDFNGFVEYYADGFAQQLEAFRKEVKQGLRPSDAEEPFRALRVANSVWKADWTQENFKDAYKESVEKNYAAEWRVFNPENAVKLINNWADLKTEHMIQKLLPDDYPTDELAIVLMNALYFKDTWQNKFSKGSTKEGDFHTRNGQTTRKDFMTTTAIFSYYEDEVTKLVILPMTGGVSMAFVLGSTDGLSEKISNASSENVTVTIPKMDLETEFSNREFVDFLTESGVSLAFDGNNADFSAMIDHQVFVSDIIQKTRIKLDEDGVEAAAVTAIMMPESAAFVPEEPKVFTADQPFSFYIYTTCNDTTAIMFAGEIVE